MPGSLKFRALSAVKIVAAMTPWLLAMYTFYWLDSSGTWTAETPHRGKLSVMMLGSGMLLSFLLYSWLARTGRNKPR